MGLSCGFSSCKDQKFSGENNNLKYFELLEVREFDNFTYVKVKFPHCSNYEGIKILIYEGKVEVKLKSLLKLDPHFQKEDFSPIARFAPSRVGEACALYFAKL